MRDWNFHPSDEILRLLAACQLDDEQETDRIEEHLENCPNCRDKVEKFERAMLPGAVSDQSIEQSGDKSEDHSAPIPETIGHYQILGVLGGGGMGTVYRGVNPHLNRLAAIKVVKSSRAFRRSSVERFQRELLAIGKLQHPNIVVALDAGMYDGSPYLVMELPDGTDLAIYVQENGPLPVKEACDIIRQAALGLHHAHEARMVHRDIKPSNLFRTTDGTIKILDLGLARFLETETEDIDSAAVSSFGETAEGQILGSPDYMSPEQTIDAKNVDSRSDIYSLGCTFFYLLTGKPPFGETTELLAKLDAHAKNDLPPLKDYRNDVPAFVENMLRKMAAKQREDRPQSAAEVAMNIERNQPLVTLEVVPPALPNVETEAERKAEETRRRQEEVRHKVEEERLAKEKMAREKAERKAEEERHRQEEFVRKAEVERLARERFFATHGTDVKAVDYNGYTLLHLAAMNNENVEIIKFLLDKGVAINAKDNDGLTPLHLAATWNGNVEVIKFLVSKGADVNAKTSDGRTPLVFATEEVRDLLIAAGGTSVVSPENWTGVH